jgi:hypothetical protein
MLIARRNRKVKKEQVRWMRALKMTFSALCLAVKVVKNLEEVESCFPILMGLFKGSCVMMMLWDSAGCCASDDQSQRGSINPEREPASIKSVVTLVSGHWSEQRSDGFAFL